MPENVSRRAVLRGAALGTAAVAGWIPAFRVYAGSSQATTTPPPNFPSGIQLYQQAYQNWSEAITIENVWTCAPASPNDVVTLANWARANGYRLRAKGMGHNWSPLLLGTGDTGAGYVLLDTTQFLTAVTTNAGASPPTFTAQTGVSMDNLLVTLENAGLGFAAIPAPGHLTLGGVLAVNAHGSAIPTTHETRVAGTSYGSLSNNILSLTAVVWSSSQNAYVLKTFQRTDPDIRPFLAHLGRAFITEVTLQVGKNQRVRCQNRYDIQVTDVFAPPSSAGSNSFASLLGSGGRIEAIWFPFTTVPWLKIWSLAPSKPFFSKEIDSPYPYTFANFVTQSQSDFLSQVVAGNVSTTPTFENGEMAIVGSGLITTGTWDVWGWTKNLYLYVQPTTLRIVEAGFAVLTARANVQRVVSEFYAKYTATLTAHQNQGTYPMNGPIEIRVTGLDNPAEAPVAGAQSPILSSVRPRPDHPEWDTCVWLDMGTIPITPGVAGFYREVEQWIWSNYTGSYAMVRPEWSKGWGSDGTNLWADSTIVSSDIPASVNAGQAANDGWDTARAILNSYDPARVFSSPFLDRLLP